MSHNHNHKHNHNRNHNKKGTSYNQTSIHQMTNFAPLPNPPSPYPATPQSSSTPGPPPFTITTTPFFKGNDAYYAIHPATMAQMSQNNEFDVADFRKEGVPPTKTKSSAYNVSDQHGSYTHTTIYSTTTNYVEHHQVSAQSPSNYNNRGYHHQIARNEQKSPSLLDEPGLQSAITQQPITQHPITQHSIRQQPIRQQSIRQEPIRQPPITISPNLWLEQAQSRPLNRMYEQGRSFMDTLNAIGINQITAIIILLMAVLLYNHFIYEKVVDTKNYDLDFERKLKDWINENFGAKVNKTIEEYMKPIADNIMELGNKTAENGRDIAINEENINSVQNKTDVIGRTADHVAEIINDQSNIYREQTAWYNAHKDSNWISKISNIPPIIMDGLVNDANKEISQGYFDKTIDFFYKGGRRLHERLVGKPKRDDQHKNVARTNVGLADTPLTLNPGDCLQFLKKDNWVEFILADTIKPTHFEYIHVDKTKIEDKDKNKSPKKFRLSGKSDDDDDDWSKIEIVNEHENIMKIEDSSIRLELIPEKSFKYLRVEYDTNENAEITRLYRFRIESDPQTLQKYSNKQINE